MESVSRDRIVRAVEADIECGVSVYDERFAQQRDRFGEVFVHEYLSEVATHMAVQIVRAFEEHDRKRYQQCARSFGTVYTFLFPVTPRAAQIAGASYALALKLHDVIEDGVHAVSPREPIIDDQIGVDTRRPQRVGAILDHPYWNAVLFCFDLVAGTLELPDAYAEEQTEFFRYHTAAQELSGQSEPLNGHLGSVAMRHAKRAQKVKFSVFFDDDDTLETVANVYLAAVRSHDAHTWEEQEANIIRMLYLYDRVLATTLGVEPLACRVEGV